MERNVIAAIFGSVFSLLMLFFAIFSLPLSVIALMRWAREAKLALERLARRTAARR